MKNLTFRERKLREMEDTLMQMSMNWSSADREEYEALYARYVLQCAKRKAYLARGWKY